MLKLPNARMRVRLQSSDGMESAPQGARVLMLYGVKSRPKVLVS